MSGWAAVGTIWPLCPRLCGEISGRASWRSGGPHEEAKLLKGKAKGAVQLSEDHDGDTYRAVYTAELEGVVYVLHCFQKKSTKGIATPKPDLDRIEGRLKDARTLHARRKGTQS